MTSWSLRPARRGGETPPARMSTRAISRRRGAQNLMVRGEAGEETADGLNAILRISCESDHDILNGTGLAVGTGAARGFGSVGTDHGWAEADRIRRMSQRTRRFAMG